MAKTHHIVKFKRDIKEQKSIREKINLKVISDEEREMLSNKDFEELLNAKRDRSHDHKKNTWYKRNEIKVGKIVPSQNLQRIKEEAV